MATRRTKQKSEDDMGAVILALSLLEQRAKLNWEMIAQTYSRMMEEDEDCPSLLDAWLHATQAHTIIETELEQRRVKLRALRKRMDKAAG